MTTKTPRSRPPPSSPAPKRRVDGSGFQERREPGMPLPVKPWLPPPHDKTDISALKALRYGSASPEQQQRALAWIIECAARTYSSSFDPDSERASNFNEGARHVGKWVLNLCNARLDEKRDEEHGG